MAAAQEYPPVRSSGGEQSPAQRQLQQLLESSLILTEDWEALSDAVVREITRQTDTKKLTDLLVEHKLLTPYQVSRIHAGKLFGLILGNFRVMERLGSGGMGIIFKAEHLRMRRPVAIKVLPVPRDQSPRALLRFFAEMRAIAQLNHPNIVAAMDAGQAINPDPDAPILHYLVMEYVPGKDLEAHVHAHGPFSIPQACELACQIGGALAEADKYHLIHRDIKPSNIILTPEGKVKLLDFGLVHHFQNRLTEPRTAMGTIDFMPPEQASDACAVDIRADIYSLGGTLFWCLTGQTPFRPLGNITQELIQRQAQTPPSVRSLKPEIPEALDAVLQRMMATKPENRFPTPVSLVRALLPFCKRHSHEQLSSPTPRPVVASGDPAQRSHRVLIVDDEAEIREMCRFALQTEGLVCAEADNGIRALEAFEGQHFDLVLLDIDMPEMNGRDVLEHLRESPPEAHLKVITFSGRASADEMAETMVAGSDDYLTKPFSLVQLRARVKNALRLKDAQDRSDLLHRNLLSVNSELEQNLSARDSDFIHARNALILALAKLVEHRDIETGAHLKRMQAYCRCLAEAAAQFPSLTGQIDPNFIQMLECCAPLHDIGKVALPDHILLKPGSLDPEERLIMQSHTTLGAETLQEVARQHGSSLGFLHLAIEIVRHHHERFDGQGYPDRLAGGDIPLAARIVAVADAYDTLRSRRVGRPSLTHVSALQVMAETSQGQFDPLLLQAFQRCAFQFERIFRDLPD